MDKDFLPAEKGHRIQRKERVGQGFESGTFRAIADEHQANGAPVPHKRDGSNERGEILLRRLEPAHAQDDRAVIAGGKRYNRRFGGERVDTLQVERVVDGPDTVRPQTQRVFHVAGGSLRHGDDFVGKSEEWCMRQLEELATDQTLCSKFRAEDIVIAQNQPLTTAAEGFRQQCSQIAVRQVGVQNIEGAKTHDTYETSNSSSVSRRRKRYDTHLRRHRVTQCSGKAMNK